MIRAALVALLATAGLAFAAAAAPAASQSLVEAQGKRFPNRAWVLTLPERRDLTSADVQLREDGRVVDDLAVVPGDQAGGRTFGVVLAIDASESMHGGAIEDAMAAAREFAARREPNQQLGLILFSREHRVALPLTNDQAKIDAALATVPDLSKGTRIYDAGSAAVRLLRDAEVQAGTVVVLSDGADAGSVATAAGLAREAKRARVRVFSVGLRSASFDPSTLAAVADQTGGAFSEASSPTQLKEIYAALGEQLARQYLITYRSMATLGSRVSVQAQIDGLGAPVLATYVAPALNGAGAPAVAGDGLTTTTLTLALLFALLVGGAVLFALRGPKAPVSDRITAYLRPHRPSLLEEHLATTDVHKSVPSRIVERLVGQARWWPRFVREVQLADVGLTAAQLVTATVGGTLFAVWVFVALDRPVAAVLFALTPIVVRAVVGMRTSRVRRAFADQLPDNLQVVASAMRAGHSFEGGLAIAAEDASEPMRTELRRVVSDERLGVPLEAAMTAVAERMRSIEFEQVGMILTAQRSAGGNVAELLDHTVDSLRQRADLRRLVTSLTSQGRFSGAVVTALPFASALFISIVQPGYFDPLLESSVGRILIAISLLMMLTAWAVIRKVIDIKV